MVRRLLIVAFSLLVAAAPLANTFCYEGCGRDGAPASTHHACAFHDRAGEKLSAAPKACATNDEVTVRITELRRTVDGLATAIAITFEPLRVNTRVQPAVVRPPTHFHSDHIPLRI